MPDNRFFYALREHAWTCGLANLWHKEQQQWWKSWSLLKRALIWLVLLDGFYALILLDLTHTGTMPVGMNLQGAALAFIVSFLSLLISAGTVIQAQGAILDERRNGTMAWILSKPISRGAFVLAKCAPLPAMILLMVLVPGLVTELQIALVLGQPLPFVTMLLLLGWLAASLLFSFCLTLFLSTLFNSRTLVISIALLIALLVSQLAQQLPPALLTQQFLLPVLIECALISSAALCLLGAILRFSKEEC